MQQLFNVIFEQFLDGNVGDDISPWCLPVAKVLNDFLISTKVKARVPLQHSCEILSDVFLDHEFHFFVPRFSLIKLEVNRHP